MMIAYLFIDNVNTQKVHLPAFFLFVHIFFFLFFCPFLFVPFGEVIVYERTLPPSEGVVIVNLYEFGLVFHRRKAGTIPAYRLS